MTAMDDVPTRWRFLFLLLLLLPRCRPSLEDDDPPLPFPPPPDDDVRDGVEGCLSSKESEARDVAKDMEKDGMELARRRERIVVGDVNGDDDKDDESEGGILNPSSKNTTNGASKCDS